MSQESKESLIFSSEVSILYKGRKPLSRREQIVSLKKEKKLKIENLFQNFRNKRKVRCTIQYNTNTNIIIVALTP